MAQQATPLAGGDGALASGQHLVWGRAGQGHSGGHPLRLCGLVDWLLCGASLDLSVPSVVEPSDRNVLLNPLHRQYVGIQVFIERQPFVFDERLLG